MTRKIPLKRGGFSSLRRTRLKPVSKKRQREAAVYAKKRKAFLDAHPFCQWWIESSKISEGLVKANAGRFFITGSGIALLECPLSCDIHHKAGRSGKNYLDESTFMAVSREGHEWIHAHPNEARAKGWLV